MTLWDQKLFVDIYENCNVDKDLPKQTFSFKVGDKYQGTHNKLAPYKTSVSDEFRTVNNEDF